MMRIFSLFSRIRFLESEDQRLQKKSYEHTRAIDMVERNHDLLYQKLDRLQKEVTELKSIIINLNLVVDQMTNAFSV